MPWLALHDVDRIQSYVFGVPRLREIRGGSGLIDHVNREMTPQLATDFGGSKIYAGGGGAAARFDDRQHAEEFVRAVSREYVERTVAATSTGAVVEFGGSVAFGDALQAAHREVRRAKVERAEAAQTFTSAFFKRCQLCGQRPATATRRTWTEEIEPPLLVCQACLLWGDWEPRGSPSPPTIGWEFRRRMSRVARRRLRAPEHLEEIGRHCGGYLGVVYLDGNRMGERLRAVQPPERLTPEGLKGFSAAVDEGMRAAVLAALQETVPAAEPGSDVLPVEIPLFGGDDVVVILPADRAVSFLARVLGAIPGAISEHFSPTARPEFAGQTEVSACGGLVIAKDHTPIAGVAELARGLCKHAKQRYREERQGPGGSPEPACIDFAVITTANWTSLDKVEAVYEVGGRRLSARPYTLPEFEGLLDAAREIDRTELPSGKLVDFYRSLWEGKARATSHYRTMFMRAGEPQRQALWAAEHSLGVGAAAPWRTRQIGSRKVELSPYPDLIELLPFLRSSNRRDAE